MWALFCPMGITSMPWVHQETQRWWNVSCSKAWKILKRGQLGFLEASNSKMWKLCMTWRGKGLGFKTLIVPQLQLLKDFTRNKYWKFLIYYLLLSKKTIYGSQLEIVILNLVVFFLNDAFMYWWRKFSYFKKAQAKMILFQSEGLRWMYILASCLEIKKHAYWN